MSHATEDVFGEEVYDAVTLNAADPYAGYDYEGSYAADYSGSYDPALAAAPAPGSGDGLDFYEGPSVGSGLTTEAAWHTTPARPTTGGSPFPSPFADAAPQSSQQTAQAPSTRPVPEATTAFWTTPFWQQFFNVDTADVRSRIISSLWPKNTPQYLAGKGYSYAALASSPVAMHDGEGAEAAPANPDPDLYGPLWICSTLWVIMAVVAQLTRELKCPKESKDISCTSSWFAPVAVAAGVIFSYQVFVPFGLWLIMKWKDVQVGLVETVCLYGYSFFVFIPAALICIVPLGIVQWLAMLVAFALSTTHIVYNLSGVWKQTLDPKWFMIVCASCVVLHFILCVSFKISFFASLSGAPAS